MTNTTEDRVEPASNAVRWLYVATLVGAMVPSSGWLQLATGGGWGAAVGLSTAGLALFGLWRAGMVIWRRSTLDGLPVSGYIKFLRHLGIAGMALGALCLLVRLALPWLAANLTVLRSDHIGMAGFMAGIYIALISSWAMAGLMLFELSRLLAFERNMRRVSPTTPKINPNHVDRRP